MSTDLANRVALVTGASAGLGAQFARVLAREGARVAIAARRTDRLASLAADITDYDPRKASWPYTFINWAAAADALKMDYSEVELLGKSFWCRS